MKRARFQQMAIYSLLLVIAIIISGCAIPNNDDVIEIPPIGGEQPLVPQEEVPVDAGGEGEAVVEPVVEEGVVEGVDQPAVEGTDTTTTEATDGEASDTTTTEGTNEAETNVTATEEAAVEEPAPQPETPPVDGIYAVQSGDTLGGIAERFGVTVDDIAAASGLANIHTLDVGQELTIPEAGFAETVIESTETAETTESGEQVHVVRSGDTLFSIGRAYGFTVQELQQFNGIANVDSLDIGQEIRIPPSSE